MSDHGVGMRNQSGVPQDVHTVVADAQGTEMLSTTVHLAAERGIVMELDVRLGHGVYRVEAHTGMASRSVDVHLEPYVVSVVVEVLPDGSLYIAGEGAL